jgi:hypothetical protein
MEERPHILGQQFRFFQRSETPVNSSRGDGLVLPVRLQRGWQQIFYLAL